MMSRHETQRPPALLSLALLGLALLVALPAVAAEPAQDAATTTAAAATAEATPSQAAPAEAATVETATAPEVAFQSGLVVVRDAETGELRPPTAAEMARIAGFRAINESSAGLVEESLADGGVKVNLEGRFESFLTVHVTPDGKRVYACNDDPLHAAEALTGHDLAEAKPDEY
jgi:hypothetical protein